MRVMIILTRDEQLRAMIKIQENKGLSAHPYVLRLREELRRIDDDAALIHRFASFRANSMPKPRKK